MSEGLEALKEIKSHYNCMNDQQEDRDNFAIIEKDLKRLNDLEMECNRLSAENQYLELEKKENEKKLEALEIIKEKPQATLWLTQYCDKETEYEDMISVFKEDITKEEYDLLKEVLL